MARQVPRTEEKKAVPARKNPEIHRKSGRGAQRMEKRIRSFPAGKEKGKVFATLCQKRLAVRSMSKRKGGAGRTSGVACSKCFGRPGESGRYWPTGVHASLTSNNRGEKCRAAIEFGQKREKAGQNNQTAYPCANRISERQESACSGRKTKRFLAGGTLPSRSKHGACPGIFP